MNWKPQRALSIIAGTPPGGGLDRSARALARAIEANRLVDVPVAVVNVPGDGGRNAWVHMERFAGDGHVISISSPNMAADYLMGVTKSDPDRYPPLAILYSEYIAFVVRTEFDHPRRRRSDRALCGRCRVRDGRALDLARQLESRRGGQRRPSCRCRPPRGRNCGCSTPRSMRSPTWWPARPTSAPSRRRARSRSFESGSLRAIAISSTTRLSGPYAGDADLDGAGGRLRDRFVARRERARRFSMRRQSRSGEATLAAATRTR